ncbi:MAG: hypothetical protein KGJ84_02610 [Elusimicrobia bacterium]|nr:hypothetical protein [Elusimicrobiota bacterium]
MDAPGDLADWPITTRITELDMTPDGIAVAFSKRDGDGSWPDETDTFGPTGPLQYSLGMAEYIDGQWYASAPIQLWRGLERSGGGPADYAKNWFYGPAWGPMRCRQPRVG